MAALLDVCGNAHHPDGPWHPAAPRARRWEIGRRVQQWFRRLGWGCGCPRLGRRETRVDVTLVFPGVSQQQAAALYAFAAELKSAGAAGESYWVSFFADGSGDLRVRPQVAISARAEAIARWAPLAARIIEPLDNVRIDEDFVAYDMFMPDRRKAPKGTAP